MRSSALWTHQKLRVWPFPSAFEKFLPIQTTSWCNPPPFPNRLPSGHADERYHSKVRPSEDGMYHHLTSISKQGIARLKLNMNALIDSDFQKVVDAINDAIPVEDGADRSDYTEPYSTMSWDLDLEAVPNSYSVPDMTSSWYCGLPDAARASDRTGENWGFEDPQTVESPDPVQAMREDLSKIQAELQELKRAVEAALELNGQRITNTEKYIDELLPWTQEVHGAVEQLLSRSVDTDQMDQGEPSSARDESKEA